MENATTRRGFLARFAALLAAPVALRALPAESTDYTVKVVTEPALQQYDLAPGEKYIYNAAAYAPRRRAIDVTNIDDEYERYLPALPDPYYAEVTCSDNCTPEDVVAMLEVAYGLKMIRWTVTRKSWEPHRRRRTYAFNVYEVTFNA